MNSLKRIKDMGKKLLLASCCLLVFTFTWASAFVNSNSAYAASVNKLPFIVADYDASNVVDRAAGAGTSNKVQGNTNEAAGVVKRNFGDTSDQVEGAAQQAKGKFQQGVGTVQGKAEESASNMDNATDNFFDSVKNIFQGE